MKAVRRLAPLALVIAALALPTSASGWKWVFQDFNFGAQGGGVAGHAEAKKCKGGKLGFYEFISTVTSQSLQHQVTADLPVFAKFRQIKNVVLTFQGSAWTSLPPEFQAGILGAYQPFYDGIFAKYKARKNKLLFRHPALVLFGNQVIPAGISSAKFKPKDKC
jgi:hypothetical protein